jgi:hypothetical protein
VPAIRPLLVARRGELSVFEIDVLRLVNDLPALIYVPVWAVMQLGNASSGGRWAAVQATTGTGRRGTAEAPVLLRLGWAPISATPVPQTGRPSVTDTIDAMESPWE